MPFEWKKGENPFRQNYYNVLQCGPNATPQQIVQKADEKIKEIVATGAKRMLDNNPVDEHLVQKARTYLMDYSNRLEEMLMAHPPTLKNHKRLKVLFQKLEKLADLSIETPELVLEHPLAALWFLPPPKSDDLDWPEWKEFGLGVAGDETDQYYDIVFDI